MALVFKDRVKVVTTTTGTGTLTLGAAVSGFQDFSVIGNGNTTYYAIVDSSTGDWEVGLGTYSSTGTTLSRDTVLESSNSGALVPFGVGDKNVFVTYAAEKSVILDASGNVSPLGTVGSGTWQGSAVDIGYGGTGQTTASAAFNALSPITTTGDLIVGNGTNSATRLGIGANGYVLTSNGTTASWQSVGAASTTANITGGAASQLVYQASAGSTAFIANGTSGQVLTSNGSSAPSWEDGLSLSDNNTWTGIQTFGVAARETKATISASNIDLATANYFSKTISGTTTFTVSNTPTTGTAASFILDLTNGGSATVNWWSGVKWAGGTAPTLTASGRDVLGFFTYDGGTAWTGLLLGLDVK